MRDGDEWKSEDTDSFSFFSTGSQMTTEERAVWDAKAAFRHSLLPPYRPNHGCVKCGHAGPARTAYDIGHFGGRRESLRRECDRCMYSWYEQVMSEEES